jgi:hypothetical protein
VPGPRGCLSRSFARSRVCLDDAPTSAPRTTAEDQASRRLNTSPRQDRHAIVVPHVGQNQNGRSKEPAGSHLLQQFGHDGGWGGVSSRNGMNNTLRVCGASEQSQFSGVGLGLTSIGTVVGAVESSQETPNRRIANYTFSRHTPRAFHAPSSGSFSGHSYAHTRASGILDPGALPKVDREGRAFFGLAIVRSATAPPPSRSQSLSWHATLTLREYDLSIGLPVTSAARGAPPHSSVEASLHHRLTPLQCGG